MSVESRFAVTALLTVLLLVTPFSLFAKDTKPPKLFSESGEMKVTLSGPWRTIMKNIKKDARYPVQLSYTGADGQQHSIDAEVAPRGLTRRMLVCDFPPLKVYFHKNKTNDTEFRGNKSLKLVTYCQTNSKYEQYFIKEFLAYRIYNLITEFSFRVRPMMIEYTNSERKGDSLTRFGFMIEDSDDVAKRNGMKELSIARVPYKQLDSATVSKFSLFQYMIGNLDWAATDGPKEDSCCHNSRLMGAGEDQDPKYVVPYDFDSSGLVNAHYALPPNGLKVRNIRQRLYRGFCFSNETMPQTVALFREKRPEILALFVNNTHLYDQTRDQAIDYIDEFYKIIDDSEAFREEITDRCRGEE